MAASNDHAGVGGLANAAGGVLSLTAMGLLIWSSPVWHTMTPLRCLGGVLALVGFSLLCVACGIGSQHRLSFVPDWFWSADVVVWNAWWMGLTGLVATSLSIGRPTTNESLASPDVRWLVLAVLAGEAALLALGLGCSVLLLHVWVKADQYEKQFPVDANRSTKGTWSAAKLIGILLMAGGSAMLLLLLAAGVSVWSTRGIAPDKLGKAVGAIATFGLLPVVIGLWLFRGRDNASVPTDGSSASVARARRLMLIGAVLAAAANGLTLLLAMGLIEQHDDQQLEWGPLLIFGIAPLIGSLALFFVNAAALSRRLEGRA